MCLCNKCDKRLKCLTDNKIEQDLTDAIKERGEWVEFFCYLGKSSFIVVEILLIATWVSHILNKGI